jgi:hypothetical protein
LTETAGLLLARLDDERSWAAEETARREWNAKCREVCQARFSRAANRPCLLLSLDLSAGNPGLGCFYKGALYEQPGDIEARYRGTWGRLVAPIIQAVEKAAGATAPGTLLPDTLVESGKRNWATYLGTPLPVAAEVAVQAQIRGLTLATIWDRRAAWNTRCAFSEKPAARSRFSNTTATSFLATTSLTASTGWATFARRLWANCWRAKRNGRSERPSGTPCRVIAGTAKCLPCAMAAAPSTASSGRRTAIRASTTSARD